MNNKVARDFKSTRRVVFLSSWRAVAVTFGGAFLGASGTAAAASEEAEKGEGNFARV